MPRPAVLRPVDRPTVQPPARRWLLLAAVMITMLAMHFLSTHDAAGDHRVLPSNSGTATEQPSNLHLATGDLSAVSGTGSGSGTTAAADAPAGDGRAVIADCILLLAVAAAAVRVLLLRPAVHRPPVLPDIRPGGRRAPPRPLSRQALCVERI